MLLRRRVLEWFAAMAATAIPSSYTVEFALPKHLPEVLKELTREVLRAQPRDIAAFARDWFAGKAAAAGAAPEDEEQGEYEEAGAYGDTWQLSTLMPSEIEEMIHALFREQDADGNHTLDRHEFKMVFNKLGAKLGLRKNDVRRILAEADCDGNGAISYAEFIPVAVSIIETIVAKEKLKESEKEKSKVVHDAERHVYHGMPREELDEILTTIFQEADTDRSGSLDLGEFERCLGDIRIGITRKEVKLLMFETYAKDGRIDYEAFKPLCMKLLVELTAAEWINPSQDDADLQAHIYGLLSAADKEGSGQLPLDEIQQILFGADLGLTMVQICSILSEAQEDAAGFVDYGAFAPRASFMINACKKYRQKLAEKKELMGGTHGAAADEGWGLIFGMDRDALEFKLKTAFEQADPDARRALNKDRIKAAIIKALGTDNADKKTVLALLQLAKRAEAAGLYQYQPIIDQAFRALKNHIELSKLAETE